MVKKQWHDDKILIVLVGCLLMKCRAKSVSSSNFASLWKEERTSSAVRKRSEMFGKELCIMHKRSGRFMVGYSFFVVKKQARLVSYHLNSIFETSK